ncbi:type II and III secretion system protein family protein [Jejubacter sp. L23]|uniref:type II and III secretion system protein family protein n=1 Tax=Jejubacter sp. L23 TaxID=3092086 RepID=UPI003D75A3A9
MKNIHTITTVDVIMFFLNCCKKVQPLLALAFLACFSASASQTYMKPGQSKTLQLAEPITTVFISNPEVADYRIVGSKSVVLYAKKRGDTSLVVYGKKARTLISSQISVDPFLGDLHLRVEEAYPGSKVQITRFVDGEKATYILSGEVPDEETLDNVHQLVGSLVGTDSEKRIMELRSAEGEKGSGDELFVRGYSYSNIINRLKTPASNQVNVKLTVVEVSKEFSDSLGIDWSSLTLDSIINRGSVINSSGMFNLLGFKGGFDAANISTVINAIKNDSVAKVLAQPNLTVLSGEQASFLVGGEIPIMIRDNDTVTVEYKEYGIRLNIAAKVNSQHKIRLAVLNELSSASGSYGYNDYHIPTMRTRRSSSTIELADGDSFIIGGLLSEEDKEALTKIPFLGDIPILGALARSAHTERNKRELVVFATVNLVKPVPASSKRIRLPIYRRSTIEQLFLNVGIDKDMRENRLSNDANMFMEQGGFAK